MKKVVARAWLVGVCVLFGSCTGHKGTQCATGAFLADKPSSVLIEKFKADHGKRPAVVLIFLDWGQLPDEAVIRDVYNSGSVLMVTWEPWSTLKKAAIDYDALLRGKDDAYIREFALRLKAIGKPVLLRFAHEMNGDWYPWSAQKISGEKYRQLFRYVRKIFDSVGAGNVRWVFSINVENVPGENDYGSCYPGDRFVDYIGLDGYNWGPAQSWSKWRSFQEIFSGIYGEVIRQYQKPVIISEFGTTSSGGDKARWIDDALKEVKRMPAVKALVLFNIDKETDWKIASGSEAGRAFKDGLADPYFKDSWTEE
jgi:beta-mannanase